MKKCLFTLNIDNYAREITRLTYPLMRHYAERIGAEFHVIRERKFPGWPVQYEKLQIHELARQRGNDWNLYFDSDTLIHPELIDLTHFIPRDTVANNGVDMAAIRWRYDKHFLRDGRNIGTCGWCIIASDWTTDIWRPLDDLTLEEALANCTPTIEERNAPAMIDPRHLLDDYVMSRNVARFGLKYTTLIDLWKRLGLVNPEFFWHLYLIPVAEKVKQMSETVERWKVPRSLLEQYKES